ncbi:hypothetical protein GIB67_023589 [Kingdonia uniflora]|uniref:ARID domain-containing protein n=1 Tax=Kingdonia uniflora TaxID=39325 RepID=A0A7J7PAU5_9MAGN|nr:hypothetical protein GIB67_023589 [Kingdonia uniflora]
MALVIAEQPSFSRSEVMLTRCFPAPKVSHEDVVSDPKVFTKALEGFHYYSGTKFTIHTVGGKLLDLHLLYVEVTKRGGFDKVVKERKWKELSLKFKFPPTVTSVPYDLRKKYLSTLYDFEKVYFFKQCPNAQSVHMYEDNSQTAIVISDPMLAYPPSHLQPEGLPTATPVVMTGIIDGQFDCGYLVTVKVGSKALRGVLFHPPAVDSSSSSEQHNSEVVPYFPPSTSHNQ